VTAIEQFQGHSLMEQAKMLAGSNLVPKAFRGKPADILVATLWGAEVGLGPIASMNFIDIIEGTPSMNAEGSAALIRRAGHSLTIDATNERAIVKGKRRDSGDEMTVTWTMADAKQAKLAGRDNWTKYPRAMLRSRAVSEIARALFSDVFMGITYSPEEVESFSVQEVAGSSPAPVGAAGDAGSVTRSGADLPQAQLPPVPIDTATGEIIDAEVVEPVTVREAQAAQANTNRKFAPPSVARDNQRQIMADFADADAVKATDALKARIAALDEWDKEALGEAWKAAGLPSVAGSGKALDAEQLLLADELVQGVEKKEGAA
jgi:hypothetical protein